MKNGITELVFIIDRSGSMEGLEGDTIGGFNAMIEKQKKQDGICWVSTVLFDSSYEILHDRVALPNVAPMTEKQYFVGGCTALIDALGSAIEHIENIHKYIREEDVPEKTVFVITTDGKENASRNYGSAQVKAMIEKQKVEHGWEFIFIGANIDAVETAAMYGIDSENAVNYRSDGQGTRILYDSVSMAVSSVRKKKRIPKEWRMRLDYDFNERKND